MGSSRSARLADRIRQLRPSQASIGRIIFGSFLVLLAVIVGDSHVDMRTGQNAGMWTVAVTYGFAPHTLEAENPDVVVDHPRELADIFR